MKLKSFSTIGKGYIIYPTNIFKRFNNYLIDEYSKLYYLIDVPNSSIFEVGKFHDKFIGMKMKEQFKKTISIKIEELKELLESNTNCNGDIKKLLNVTDWEELLDEYYTLLNNTLLKYNFEPLKSKNFFLRKEKLERLNNI